jgi:hypothetical protein
MKHFLNAHNLRVLGCVMLSGILVSSCQKDIVQKVVDEDAATVARATYTTKTVNWDNRSDGTYTTAEAAEDFGNISGWVESRAYNSSGTCRITLLKNALSGAGGVVSTIDIPDGQQYELTFDVKYHSQFDWSRGGKVGFGFGIGDGNAGGDPAWDGNGGSLRIMWYQDDSNRVYFHPYVYYKDQPGQYGDNFGKSYPSSGSINRSQWYTVYMFAQSNTGSNKDGWVTIKINGTTILNQAIRWTTNDAKRLINSLWFMTFRGGSETYWQSSTDGYIYFDNLWWKKDS